MAESELGPFLKKHQRAGEHDSSGTLTLERARAARLLVEHTLEDPALAVLWVVQAAVASGASKLRFHIHRNLLSLRLVKPELSEVPLKSPESYLGGPQAVSHGRLALALRAWSQQGLTRAECRWFVGGAVWMEITDLDTPLPARPEGRLDLGIRLHRKVKKSQVEREIMVLRERCRFCPVQIWVNEDVVQSANYGARRGQAKSLLPADFHLAEYYRGGSGLAIFRSDWNTPLDAGHLWLDSGQTLQREVSGDTLQALRWTFPDKVAGMTARTVAHRGVQCSAAAFLLPEQGLPATATPVLWGVSARSLAWSGPPGVHLAFDASQRATDLSGLALVQDDSLLAGWEQALDPWVQRVSRGMMSRLKDGSAFSWQTRREIKVIMGLFGATVITGASAFLPLPFLGLPWAMWYYGSRRKAIEKLRQRCLELAGGVGPSSKKVE